MSLHDFQTVIVPIAGDNTDREAISVACSLFRTKSNPRNIVALRVIEIDRSLPVDADLTTDIMQAEALLQRVKEENKDILDKYECDFTPDVKQARDAGPAIVEDADEFNADLIVVTIDTKHEFGEYSLGDVAPYVLENAHCRVIVDQLTIITED